MTTTKTPKAKPEIQKQGFRPEEAGRAIGVGETTARGLIKEGKLKSIRIGRAIVVPQWAIDEFLAGAAAAPSNG